MDGNGAKIVAMAALGLGSVAVGMAPALKRSTLQLGKSLWRSCLLCFGAGVLLATSILHMLPETREVLPDHAEISFCGGFFLIYLIDEVAHSFYGNADDSDRHRSERHRHSYGSTERASLLDVDIDEPVAAGCHRTEVEPCSSTATGRSGLLLALSAHSLLEGLAVGLEQQASKVLMLLGAVASHKFVVGFCLGCELTANNTLTLCGHFVSILIFSMGSVAGIGIGMLIEGTTYSWSNTVLGVMQGLAGGTLLYVTLSEVLPRERARLHHNISAAGLIQFAFTLTGFVMMYFLNKYIDA